MKVRDVYIVEAPGERARDLDYDTPETEGLDDVRYVRRLRRAVRGRRAAAIADIEIEDEAANTPVEETGLGRGRFGGGANLGAALAVIGLLIMAAAWTGPSWGWGAGGYTSPGPSAYGLGRGPRAAYAEDYGYPDEPDDRYSAVAFDMGPGSLVEPPRAMLAGGTLLVVGLMLMATRRGFLFS